MIQRCEAYFLDCGRKFQFCPLKVSAPPFLVPLSLAPLLQPASLGYCALPIIPRRANLTMFNGEIFFIEYPFNASMSEWVIFWQELKQNSAIVHSENIGETVNDSFLRSYLF